MHKQTFCERASAYRSANGCQVWLSFIIKNISSWHVLSITQGSRKDSKLNYDLFIRVPVPTRNYHDVEAPVSRSSHGVNLWDCGLIHGSVYLWEMGKLRGHPNDRSANASHVAFKLRRHSLVLSSGPRDQFKLCYLTSSQDTLFKFYQSQSPFFNQTASVRRQLVEI
jgi:hypothetical protein